MPHIGPERRRFVRIRDRVAPVVERPRRSVLGDTVRPTVTSAAIAVDVAPSPRTSSIAEVRAGRVGQRLVERGAVVVHRDLVRRHELPQPIPVAGRPRGERVLHRGLGRVGAELLQRGPPRSVLGRRQVVDDTHVLERGVRRAHVPRAVALHRDHERADVGRDVARVDHGLASRPRRRSSTPGGSTRTTPSRWACAEISSPCIVDLRVARVRAPRCRVCRSPTSKSTPASGLPASSTSCSSLRPVADAVDAVAQRADLVGREHVDGGQRVLVLDRVRELAHGTLGRVRTAAAEQRRRRRARRHRASRRAHRRSARCATAAAGAAGSSSMFTTVGPSNGSGGSGSQVALHDRRAARPHHRSSRRARRSRRPTRSPRRAPHRRRARCHGWRAGPEVRSCHSPLDSTLSSTRSRRRARINATRADGADIPTSSAASFDRMPSTSTRYSSARTRSGNRSRSVSSLG